MHRGIYEKTQQLESSKFVEPQYEIEEISKSKPYFVVPLSDPKPVSEGKNIHLECRFVLYDIKSKLNPFDFTSFHFIGKFTDIS